MNFSLLYSLICFILLTFLSCSIAQTSRNVSLGSSLTSENGVNSSWSSPSGEFAFGFRQIEKDAFLLAIWFSNISEGTIVWSANGDSLVPQGSKVELTSDGQFMLNDASGNQIWSVGIIGAVSYAAMLDTGNFVLANEDSSYLWESFDQPTDTILPTQILKQGSTLFARHSLTNYSRGRFMFTLKSDGSDLSLYTTNFPQDSARSSYWSAINTDIGFRVIFNQSGLIYLTSRNGTILSTLSSTAFSMQEVYQRATLEYDGVLRQYVYPKRPGSGTGRSMAWSITSSTPSNICLSIVEPIGGGACGINGLCRLDELGPTCLCPNGYTLIDSSDVLKGCKPNFVPQRCDLPEADAFVLQETQNTNMPNLDYEHFQGVSEDWCRQSCLEDCLCSAAIYNTGRDCFKKALPFANGMIDPSLDGTKALIKRRKDNGTSKPGCTYIRKKENSTLILVGSVLLSSLGILNFILPLLTYLVVSRVYSRTTAVDQPLQIKPGTNLKCFTYEEVKQATNEFKEELGRGASATVFKGVFTSDEGKCVAIKVLDAKVREGDSEFNAEVSAIGRTNHRNLVQLHGFCNEGQHRILVYEYMSNGSLASFLFGDSRPNWYQREQIALGTARGLLYLHEECSSQIIHCDIKPQNILLDELFTARISDFGLAKLLGMDQTRTNTGIRGTRGYVAPEWFRNLPITAKVDVYSYGILLLEIICCRKKFDQEAEVEDQMILADWAYDCYKQKELHLLLENNDEPIEDMKKMEKYVMIAMWCIQEDPKLRPTMKKLIQMLEGTAEVSVPPDPFTFI